MNKHDTYLITGATGQLWPMVLKSLLEQEIAPESIHLLVRSQEKAMRVFDAHGFPTLPTIIGDITEDQETLRGKVPSDITHFVNMAGSVKFGESARPEVERVNLHWAMTIAKIARAQWKLTHVSTSYILGQVDDELQEIFIDKNTERKPKNPYEEAKWNAEVAVREVFKWAEERLQIVRPSILTDSMIRPDLGSDLHAAMWYYAPFIYLRKELVKKWVTGYIDLEGFEFAGNFDNPINIIDNGIAGNMIGEAIKAHSSRVLHVVNKTPPAYGDLTNYVLQTLQFTGYKINGEVISNAGVSKKISDVEQGKVLQRIMVSSYNRNSKPNYYPYATHNSRFAGGVEMDNQKLAKSAVQSLLQ